MAAVQYGKQTTIYKLLCRPRGISDNNSLHKACYEGDLKALELVDPKSCTELNKEYYGSTPLFIAVSRKHFLIVKKLLELGANINYRRSKYSISALGLACSAGDEEMVALLLQHGADVHVIYSGILTPLHVASISGNPKVVATLLKNGARVNVSKYQTTPLQDVVNDSNIEVAQLLLEAGERTEEKAKLGLTPLHIACTRNNVEMIKLLVSHRANVNATSNSGYTPLHYGIQESTTVEILLNAGARIDKIHADSQRVPIHMAIEQKREESAKLLICRGANVNIGCRSSTTLHMAADSAMPDVVEMLLKAGVDVNAKSMIGTALHIASNRSLRIVELLLSHGANVNERLSDGSTPLHLAGTKQIAELLLAHGAELNAIDSKSQTPLHTASSLPRPYGNEIVDVLVKKGADVNAKTIVGLTPLHFAMNNLETAEYLLQCGASMEDLITPPYAWNAVEFLHKKGWKRPYLAETLAKKGKTNVEKLIKSGVADLDLTFQGLSAVHYAFLNGFWDCAKMLIQFGAKVTPVPDTVKSPLHCVAGWKFCDKLDLIQLVVQNGFDINTRYIENIGSKYGPKNTHVLTPLHCALTIRFSRAVELLVSLGAEYSLLHTTEANGKTTVTTCWQICEESKEDKDKYLALLGNKWTPANHKRHPLCIREAIKLLLLINYRSRHHLDMHILHRIFEWIAYSWQPVM